jgi:asparagine N-glycosylation enzyme membrane subunit Stt3
MSWIYLLSGMAARAGIRFRYVLGTIALAVVCGLVCLAAAGFVVAALYNWLGLYWPPHLAMLAISAGLLLLAIVLLMMIRLRGGAGRGAGHGSTRETSTIEDAANLTEDAAHRAALAAGHNVRRAPTGALLAAVAVGVAVGLLRPSDRP